MLTKKGTRIVRVHNFGFNSSQNLKYNFRGVGDKVSLCAIARNENNYIREWVEHYRNIGFDYIFIFDNNDANGERITDVTDEFGDFVTVDTRYRGKTDRMHQTEAYTEFYNNNKHKYAWICFFDIDEFIILEKHDNIKDFLKQEKFKNADGVRVCWKIYTDSGIITVTDGNYSKERFTEYTEFNSKQCKTIVRGGLQYVNTIGVHGTRQLRNPVNTRGERCANGNGIGLEMIGNEKCWEGAWLNHYRFRTIQEFIDLKMKNWHQKNIKSKWITFDAFFRVNEKTQEKLDYIKKHTKI